MCPEMLATKAGKIGSYPSKMMEYLIKFCVSFWILILEPLGTLLQRLSLKIRPSTTWNTLLYTVTPSENGPPLSWDALKGCALAQTGWSTFSYF